MSNLRRVLSQVLTGAQLAGASLQVSGVSNPAVGLLLSRLAASAQAALDADTELDELVQWWAMHDQSGVPLTKAQVEAKFAELSANSARIQGMRDYYEGLLQQQSPPPALGNQEAPG